MSDPWFKPFSCFYDVGCNPNRGVVMTKVYEWKANATIRQINLIFNSNLDFPQQIYERSGRNCSLVSTMY